MSPWSTLLRLFLVAVLALNGSGAAAAIHWHQGSEPDGNANRRALADEAAAVPCHAHPQDEGASEHSSAEDAATVTGDDSDCCASMGCDCPCSQHVSVATLDLGVAAAIVHQEQATGPFAPGHAAPAASRLIRPPISQGLAPRT